MRSILLASVLLAQVSNPPSNGNLSAILSRYGGSQKITMLSYYLEGSRCMVGKAAAAVGGMNPCQNFKLYHAANSDLRIEDQFGPVRTVTIVRQNAASRFIMGPWWQRALLLSTGLKDGPLDSREVLTTRLSEQSSLEGFLARASLGETTDEGRSTTLDGRPADVFSIIVGRATVRFLFDPDTHLCIQRTQTAANGQLLGGKNFSDIRDVDGFPVPFRTQSFGGRSAAYQEETLTGARFGIPLDDRLFTRRPNLPLWVLPLVSACIFLSLAVGLVWFLIRRQRVTPPPTVPTSDTTSL